MLWWDGVQTERQNKGKTRIKSLDIMVAKFKGKFMPKDYQLNLFGQLQNLRNKIMKIKEYTGEFYRLNIRVAHIEEDFEKFVGYINGLRYEIQDEIICLSLRTIEYAYRFEGRREDGQK